MKAFIITKEQIDLVDITSYEIVIAKSKGEINKLRMQGAYEVPKKQAVEIFGMYLPFANNQNTRIQKTDEGFDIQFLIKKEIDDKIANTSHKIWLYLKRILVALDQLANTLFRGYEDESLSSRFYRWSLKDGVLWKIPAKIVDTLLFFDKDKDVEGKTIRHCEKSFENELKRTGFPVAMR